MTQQQFEQCESLRFEQVHAAWNQHLPAFSGVVLDLGCGSGRDAAALSKLGHQVVAVDRDPEALKFAKSLHLDHQILWLHDSLPDLRKVERLSLRYDLILLSGVWMFLSEHDRVMRKLSNLLRPEGKLVISIRPPTATDSFDEISGEDVISLAQKKGLHCLQHSTGEQDFLGRDLTWSTLVFQLPDDGTGGFPQLRNIILNDSKSSTYKLGLLRVLLRIADGAAGMVVDRDDDFVSIPMGLVALYWLRCYIPLVKNDVRQVTDFAGRMGFVKEGFQELSIHKDILTRLRVGMRFSGKDAIALQSALVDSRNTIKAQPMNYITGAEGRQIFKYEGRRTGQSDLVTIDTEFLASFGIFKVPTHLWDTILHYSCWIEPVILNEWSRLLTDYNQGSTSDFLSLLQWFEVEHDTSLVRSRYEKLCAAGSRHPCVWTNNAIQARSLQIDHCFPFAHWQNNDLWNLVPTSARVNASKSNRLVANELLLDAKGRIQQWWEDAYLSDDYRDRFFKEASASLPIVVDTSDLQTVFLGMQSQRAKLFQDQQLLEWSQ